MSRASAHLRKSRVTRLDRKFTDVTRGLDPIGAKIRGCPGRSAARAGGEWCAADPGSLRPPPSRRSRISGAPLRCRSRCTASGTRDELILAPMGLDPRVHPFFARAYCVIAVNSFAKGMDARVKPAHDNLIMVSIAGKCSRVASVSTGRGTRERGRRRDAVAATAHQTGQSAASGGRQPRY